MSSMKLFVLFLLCMQNTMFTVLRRYSQGVLKENYSKVSQSKWIAAYTSHILAFVMTYRTPHLLPQYEVLLVGEVIKMIYSAHKVGGSLEKGERAGPQLRYLLRRSAKMLVLALIYGAMNILSFVALRNISAGMFTIFAQLKILTTATCSRQVSPRQVLFFMGHLLNDSSFLSAPG
jgi:UDP-sugar transporter A1/2/3